jgi:hypothetical protein
MSMTERGVKMTVWTLASELQVTELSRDLLGILVQFTSPWTVSHRRGPGCYIARSIYRLARARCRRLRGAGSKGEAGDAFQERAIRYLRNRTVDVGAFRISAPGGRLCFLYKTGEYRKMTPMGRILIRTNPAASKGRAQ